MRERNAVDPAIRCDNNQQHSLEGCLKLIAVPKELFPPKHVQPQPGSGHGHHQTSDVPQMANDTRAHER